jgi:hypothetical protein
LLDRYRHYRIDSREYGVARNALLTQVTERMVNSRTLSVALREMANANIPDLNFKGSLSDEVLSRNENGRISYSHNILFDFGLSKLLLDEQNVMSFVLAEARAGSFPHCASVSSRPYRDIGPPPGAALPFYRHRGNRAIATSIPRTQFCNRF